MLYASGTVAVLLSRHTTTGSQVVDAKVSEIRFGNSWCDGRLDVVGEDRSDVALEWKDSWSLRQPQHRVTTRNGQLQVDVNCPFVPVWSSGSDLVARVPRGLHLIGGTDSGALTVRGVTAGMDLTNDSGSIDVSEVAGEITLRADSGSVRASRVAAGSALTVQADSGAIRLDLDQVPSAIQATADSGSVRVAVPPGTEWDVDADTESGSRRIEVQLRTGAPPMRLRADSGSVLATYL